MKAGFREELQQKVLYATVSDKCYRITSDGSNEVQALQCQQEEADGRLLLHAAHAAEEGYEGVILCSEDTDVFIMALAFHDKMGASLCQKCGTRTTTRIADVRKVAATHGIDVCRALIGMHSYAFTGCDTVSAFAGKGKTNVLKLLTTAGTSSTCSPSWRGMGPFPRTHERTRSIHLPPLRLQRSIS